MNHRPFYLHIEGMDLAGKSSVCRRFSADPESGFCIRRNALSDDNPVYALADRLRREDAYSAAALGHLFVAALAVDLERFQWPARPTVQDSTILLRSLAYHTAVGTAGLPGRLEELLAPHPRFDLSIVLTANQAARRRRLEARLERQPAEVAPDDLLVIRRPELFFRMEQQLVELARTHFNARVIDTSDLTEKEVFARLLRLSEAQRRKSHA